MNTWKALQYMVISTASFTFMNSIIKYLDSFHAFELVFFRSIGSVVICLAYLKAKKIPMLGNQRKLMIGRGIVGLTGMILFFSALKLIPFGTAVSLRYLAPVFAAIFSVYLLKEKILPVQWLFFGISFFGIILLRGFDLRVGGLGLVLILTCAFFSGLVYIFLRAIGPRDHPVVVVNYFMIIATIVGLIGSLNVWIQPTGYEWLLLGSLGIFGYLGQLYMTKAFQIAEANRVAPMKYIEAIFALAVGWIWFHESYTWLGLIGIFLIVSGMLLNILVRKVKKD